MNRRHETLERLAAERPPQLDVVDEARRRRDLAGILATGGDRDRLAGNGRPGGRARPPRGRRRLVLRTALAAALAGAVVVAVAVVPDNRSGRGGGRAAPATRAPARAATPKDLADPRSSAFLLASATRLLRGPASPAGPYWYMRVRNLVLTSADAFSRQPRGLRFQVRIESTAESWMPRHQGTGHLVDPASLGDVKIGFPTARDRAAWRAAGSPRIDYPPAGVGRAEDVPGTILEVDVPGSRPLSVDQFLRLPTDPPRLEAKIRSLRRVALEGRKVQQGGRSTFVFDTRKVPVTDGMVFETVAGWLASAPTTTKLQASLYRVIAGLPGVRYEATATDQAGRHGVAISMLQPSPRGSDPSAGRFRTRLIINPASGQLLASEQVVVTPGRSRAGAPAYPAGTIVSAQAFLARHWTDGPGPHGWPTNPPGAVTPKG
jgi:hypothetical protein